MIPNTRLIVILLIVLSLPVNLFAGKKITFRFRKSVPLRLTTDKMMAYCLDDNILYYSSTSFDAELEYNKNSTDSVGHWVYTYNFSTANEDSIWLVFPKDTQMIKYSMHNISVNKDYIALTFDKIYVFTKPAIRFHGSIPGYNNTGIKLLDRGILFIYKNYSNHPMDDSIDTKLILYNIEKNKEIKYQKPFFNYIGYSHLVNNFIDCTDDEFAFAQTIPYSISIYSANDLKKNTTITGGQFANDSRYMRVLDSVHRNAKNGSGIKEMMYALRKMDSLTRIEKITFLNRHTIMVSKTIPNGKWLKRSLDLWEKKGNKWLRTVTDQLYETEKNYDYHICDTSLPLDLTFSDKLVASDGVIHLINTKISPVMGISKSDYQKEMDVFYTTHPLNYYLWEYTWETK